MLTLAVDLPSLTHRATAKATLPNGEWANVGNVTAIKPTLIKAEQMYLTRDKLFCNESCVSGSVVQ